ncbi:MAG: tetratricopeptide repeat protein [Alphaproteobacteria bacterium]|nr:tetratricopeptide repeat protein [Alphaproteobacteria bacterium]
MRSLLLALLLPAAAQAGPLTGLDGPRDADGTPADHVVPQPLPADAPYAPSVYKAAADLKMSRDFIHGVSEGLELLYHRRYREMRAWFAELQQVFPGTAVAPMGDLLAWQALMLENFDYRFDAQYQAASQLARTELAAAQAQPGHEVWEEILLAVVVGIEAIHDARRSRYLGALRLAFEAIDHVEKARALAPTFVDLQLADGLYNFWRTVLTEQSKVLPTFGSRKEEGLLQIRKVIDEGVFLSAMARFALAISWLEEEDHAKARDELLANFKRYPDNIINTMLLGMTLVYMDKHEAGLDLFDQVLRVEPRARRVHYYRAVALQELGRLDEAVTALQTYLAFDAMEPYQRGGAHFRLGQIRMRQQRWDEAEVQLREAVRIHDGGRAKEALDRIRRMRKEGRIPG